MNRIAVILLVGVALAGAALLAVAQGSEGKSLLRPDDPATVAEGAAVYAETCAACHGTRLEGQPNWRERGEDGLLPAPPHDETGHTWHHDGETLFRLTKFGVAKLIDDPDYATAMPAYEGTLSDDEIVAVLSYIKSTWPPEIRARHDEMERSK